MMNKILIFKIKNVSPVNMVISKLKMINASIANQKNMEALLVMNASMKEIILFVIVAIQILYILY